MATTYLVPFAHGQQVDATGTPYSGALLYVYQTGTTTAVSLFSDSAGVTSAANPIVGDSSGRIAQRYTTYSGALTLTLKTSGGTTIWTQNDIYPVVHAGGLIFAGDVSLAKASPIFTIDASSGAALLVMDREAGNLGYLSARTANVERWRVNFATADAEAGSDAGSEFSIVAYTDAGASIGTALLLDRSSLAATLGGAMTVTGASTLTGAVTGSNSIKSTHATGGIGYGTGAGGTVTQATSKSTGVTLNKVTGQITTHNATLNAGAEVGFTLTNSAIAATDVVAVSIASGATADSYHVEVDAVAAGSCRISLTNVSASNLGEALVLNFLVLKGVNA